MLRAAVTACTCSDVAAAWSHVQAHAGKLEGILDTVSAQHDAVPLLSLLGINGTLVVLGVPPEPTSIPNGALQMGMPHVA